MELGAHPATQSMAKAFHPTMFLKSRDGPHDLKSFMTHDSTSQLNACLAPGPNGIHGKTN